MAQKQGGTSGFSKLDLLAIQMAVDICELLIDADRRHNGDLEMYDVDDEETPKMLCVVATLSTMVSRVLNVLLKGAEALRRVSLTSAKRYESRGCGGV